MKKLIISIAVTLTLAVAIGGAYARSSDLQGPQTIRAIAIGGHQEFLDLNPGKTDATGNQFTVLGPLFRASNHKDRIGRLLGVCTLLSPQFTGAGQCSFTAVLPRGSVIFAGPLTFTVGASNRLGVTGGTRKYRNTRGEVLAKSTGGNSEAFEFRLIP